MSNPTDLQLKMLSMANFFEKHILPRVNMLLQQQFIFMLAIMKNLNHNQLLGYIEHICIGKETPKDLANFFIVDQFKLSKKDITKSIYKKLLIYCEFILDINKQLVSAKPVQDTVEPSEVTPPHVPTQSTQDCPCQ